MSRCLPSCKNRTNLCEEDVMHLTSVWRRSVFNVGADCFGPPCELMSLWAEKMQACPCGSHQRDVLLSPDWSIPTHPKQGHLQLFTTHISHSTANVLCMRSTNTKNAALSKWWRSCRDPQLRWVYYWVILHKSALHEQWQEVIVWKILEVPFVDFYHPSREESKYVEDVLKMRPQLDLSTCMKNSICGGKVTPWMHPVLKHVGDGVMLWGRLPLALAGSLKKKTLVTLVKVKAVWTLV